MKKREADIIARTYADAVAEVDDLSIRMLSVSLRFVELSDDDTITADELRGMWMNEAYADVCKFDMALASLESAVAADARFSAHQKERFRREVISPTRVAVDRLHALDRDIMQMPTLPSDGN